jgi:DNA-binding NarL/FixJ family response regulator
MLDSDTGRVAATPFQRDFKGPARPARASQIGTSSVPVINAMNSPIDSFWPDLVAGRAHIVASGATREHYFFHVASTTPGRISTKLTLRRLQFLERVLLGAPQKVVALETGCSPSAVAVAVRDALRALGLTNSGSHVPALLVMLVHMLHGKARRVDLRLDYLPGADGEVQVLSSARPELMLCDRLTPTELEVIGLLVEGSTYAEIAMHRCTSARTIANQIASAYRKLKVSGRLELLCYLACRLEEGPRPRRGAEGERRAPN